MSWSLRLPFLSLSVSQRAVAVGSVLMLLLTLGAVLALRLGSYTFTETSWLSVLLGAGSDIDRMILMDHRLPRILTALGAGACFGLSGAMFQTMMRNPLASPDVIGFNAGASCGALLAIILTGGNVLLGALVGALFTAVLVVGLAWKDGLHPQRLVLIGLGIGFALAALSDLLLSRTDARTAADMAEWLIGTLNARDWQDVWLVWSGLLLLAPAVFWIHFPLARLGLSDDLTSSLGLRLSPLRLGITGLGILLAALAVCTAGPLPFVAFAAGPIARALVPNGRPALLGAAVIGALLVLAADTASRLVPSIQLPAGVFTALIGGPVMIWLLMVQFRKGKL